MKQIKTFFISCSFLLATPFAYILAAPQDFKSLVNDLLINSIIRPVVPLLIGLAVVFFVYGVFKYVFANGGEDKEKGRDFMIWGVIGLFVMISVWGLVNVVKDTFNLNDNPQTIKITAPKI